jgi:hypothetical protein
MESIKSRRATWECDPKDIVANRYQPHEIVQKVSNSLEEEALEIDTCFMNSAQ